MTSLESRFAALWGSLAPVGRTDEGGYLRYSWTGADLECRDWFTEEALDRDLTVETTATATCGPPGSLPALIRAPRPSSPGRTSTRCRTAAATTARSAWSRRCSPWTRCGARGVTPARPVKIAVFTEEEGSRFGLACLGSRLATGAVDPAVALKLTDRDGVTLADAMTVAGLDPHDVGPDPARVAGIEAFVELHVEQGRWLADTPHAVGLASAIWPHGRWRLDFTGEGNHAGTTRMADRHDPMLTFAYTVLAANKEARLSGGHATIGRVEAAPNATNAIPARVSGWLDARAADDATLAKLVESVSIKAAERADRDGTGVSVTVESVSAETVFTSELLDRLRSVRPDAPVLPTGAGHDAGVLSGHVPTAMLFVRNPTGISHAPAESATDADCAAGVVALADVLTELAC